MSDEIDIDEWAKAAPADLKWRAGPHTEWHCDECGDTDDEDDASFEGREAEVWRADPGNGLPVPDCPWCGALCCQLA